jgi:hypothetical protein
MAPAASAPAAGPAVAVSETARAAPASARVAMARETARARAWVLDLGPARGTARDRGTARVPGRAKAARAAPAPAQVASAPARWVRVEWAVSAVAGARLARADPAAAVRPVGGAPAARAVPVARGARLALAVAAAREPVVLETAVVARPRRQIDQNRPRRHRDQRQVAGACRFGRRDPRVGPRLDRRPLGQRHAGDEPSARTAARQGGRLLARRVADGAFPHRLRGRSWRPPQRRRIRRRRAFGVHINRATCRRRRIADHTSRQVSLVCRETLRRRHAARQWRCARRWRYVRW